MFDLAGKDYLDTQEAAYYCCVSVSQFKKLAPGYGLYPFRFMGKNVYRKADLRRSLEHEAAWQLSSPETRRRGGTRPR